MPVSTLDERIAAQQAANAEQSEANSRWELGFENADDYELWTKLERLRSLVLSSRRISDQREADRRLGRGFN